MNAIKDNCVFIGLTKLKPDQTGLIKQLCEANQGPDGGVNSLAVLEALEERGLIRLTGAVIYPGLPAEATAADFHGANTAFKDYLSNVKSDETTAIRFAPLHLEDPNAPQLPGHFETLPPGEKDWSKVDSFSAWFSVSGGYIITF